MNDHCFLCDKSGSWPIDALKWIYTNFQEKKINLCVVHQGKLEQKLNPPNFQDRDPGQEG